MRLLTSPSISTPADSREALLAAVAQCDFLLPLMHDKIDGSIIAANPDLRAIASMAVTPSDIDIEEATRSGIVVTTVPALVTESTADICFGLIIAVARRIVEGDQLVRRGGFPGGQSNHLIGGGVFSKTLGLIERRTHRFGCRPASPRLQVKCSLRVSPPQASRVRAGDKAYIRSARRIVAAVSDFVLIHSPLRRRPAGGTIGANGSCS